MEAMGLPSVCAWTTHLPLQSPPKNMFRKNKHLGPPKTLKTGPRTPAFPFLKKKIITFVDPHYIFFLQNSPPRGPPLSVSDPHSVNLFSRLLWAFLWTGRRLGYSAAPSKQPPEVGKEHLSAGSSRSAAQSVPLDELCQVGKCLSKELMLSKTVKRKDHL